MIGSLRGEVLEQAPAGDHAVELLVEVGGVGYRVLVTTRTTAALLRGGGEARLWVHTHVREGAVALYGFAEPAERRTFELLVATHGVGPALALAILGVHSPEELARAVVEEDLGALTLVPGVGRKTAQRLLVELRGRLAELDGIRGAVEGAGGVGVGVSAGEAARGRVAEVALALEQLGYRSDEVSAALKAVRARLGDGRLGDGRLGEGDGAPGEGLPDTATLLRLALRELGARR